MSCYLFNLDCIYFARPTLRCL